MRIWIMLALLATQAAAQDIASTGSHRLLSRGNSTAATLGSDGVFLGTPVEAHAYSWITATLDTDVPGTLYLEYSSDGVLANGTLNPAGTWYSQAYPVEKISVVQERVKFSLAISGSFARARYVNLSTAQGTLELEVILHNHAPDPSLTARDHPTFGPFIATFTITGRANLDGVSINDTWAIWGFPKEEPDWTKSGVVTVRSDDPQDTPTGTGVATVLLIGPGTDDVILIEPVVLDGTDPVDSVGEFRNPVTEMVIIGIGSGAADNFGRPAGGKITATIDGANSAVIRGDLGDNSAQSVNVRVAATRAGLPLTAVFLGVDVTVGKFGAANGTVEIEFWSKLSPQAVWIRSAPTLVRPTDEPGHTPVALALAVESGGLLMCLASSDKAVNVAISGVVTAYGPRPTKCVGSCP